MLHHDSIAQLCEYSDELAAPGSKQQPFSMHQQQPGWQHLVVLPHVICCGTCTSLLIDKLRQLTAIGQGCRHNTKALHMWQTHVYACTSSAAMCQKMVILVATLSGFPSTTLDQRMTCSPRYGVRYQVGTALAHAACSLHALPHVLSFGTRLGSFCS